MEANEKQYPRFLAPYQNSYKMGENSTEVLHDLLHQNRKILPNRHDHTIQVAYQHPDREIAANIANLYHRSYQNYIIQLRANHHGLTSYDQTQHQTELERIPQQRSEYLISKASLHHTINGYLGKITPAQVPTKVFYPHYSKHLLWGGILATLVSFLAAGYPAFLRRPEDQNQTIY